MHREGQLPVRLDLACEVLREFGALRFRAHGSSMVPSIYPGDILSVRRTAIYEVKCGDVVLYSRGPGICAHRVVRVLAKGGQHSLITRGDALRQEDAPVSKEELLGRVVSIARHERQTALRAAPQRHLRALRWCAQRSDLVVKLLLHLHARRFRGRVNALLPLRGGAI